jgi:hypothetical protein
MTAIISRKKIIVIASLVIILGLASFGLLGFLISMGGPEPLRPATYPNKPGFQNAMIWFELAASKQEVFQVLGDPGNPQGSHIREVMDKENTYDYGYMVAYSLLCIFIAALVFYLNQNKPDIANTKSWIFYFCIFICIAMLAGDAMENVQLLKLTKYAGMDDINDAVVTALNIWTRVKWGAIFIYAMIMAFAYGTYFRGKKFPQALFVIAYGSSAIIGIISLSIMNMRYLAEPASYLIALSWLLSIVHAGIVIGSSVRVR